MVKMQVERRFSEQCKHRPFDYFFIEITVIMHKIGLISVAGPNPSVTFNTVDEKFPRI